MVATKGNGWELAPSLIRLMDDVDDRWPKRSKTHDGSIGDAAHAARSSEHNPDRDSDDMPRGYVSAVDITKDSAAMAKALLEVLIGDDRVWYVIHAGFIYSRTHGWAKREYVGPNPHTHHLHVSLVQTKKAANDTGGWIGPAKITPVPAPPSTPVKKLPVLVLGGSDKVLVPFLKRFYGLDDKVNGGLFTRALLGKVRAYQQKQGLVVDGVVGAKTWAKIASGGTKLPKGYKL